MNKFKRATAIAGVLLTLLFLGGCGKTTTTYTGEDYRYICVERGLTTKCDVTLSDTIREPSKYFGLQQLTSSLKPDDEIVVHLAGNGGIIDGMMYIINIMRTTEASVSTVVEGSVASAHAVLSMGISNKVKFPADGVMFIHTASSTNETLSYCGKTNPLSTDRGVNSFAKCVENTEAETRILNRIMLNYLSPYMTEQEVQSVMKGHDLILSFTEWKARTGK